MTDGNGPLIRLLEITLHAVQVSPIWGILPERELGTYI